MKPVIFIMVFLDGFIFGFFDNFILILGTYFGVTIEYRIHRLTHDYKTARRLRDFLRKNSRGVVGGLMGAGLSHVVSNGFGAFVDPTLNHMFIGIAIGTLVPVLFIPIIEALKSKRSST